MKLLSIFGLLSGILGLLIAFFHKDLDISLGGSFMVFVIGVIIIFISGSIIGHTESNPN